MTSTMTPLYDIRHKLGITEHWSESGGVHWLASSSISVRKLAVVMNGVHARFITITAYQLPKDEGFRLEYHWDLDGQLLGFSFVLSANTIEAGKIESIYDLCEAVDWIEREIHEEYDLDFVGREYEPLLLRTGDTAGVNLREAVAVSNAVAPNKEKK